VDAEQILGGLIRGALGARQKRHRGALDFLTGSGGLLNVSNVVAAAGVAWGLYEVAMAQAPAAAPTAEGGQPPPLPTSRLAAAPPHPAVPASVLTLVRLTVSAARADGDLSIEERGQILEQAKRGGLEDQVVQEIQQPHSLDEIVTGVSDPLAREEMYCLAYAIVRADETVGGAERVYLAQLAARLGLDPAAVARLEARVAVGIDRGTRGGT
jgi:uncharacterized membrane protein YebE (DUF533 family)